MSEGTLSGGITVDPTPAGRVAVGVDSSPTSEWALDWAAREAVADRRGLHVLHAPTPLAIPGARVLLAVAAAATGSGAGRSAASDVVEAATARVRSRHPTLSVTSADVSTDEGQPSVGVATRGAHLLVLGYRHPQWSGCASTAALVADASCPTVVVKDWEDPHRPRSDVVVGLDGAPDSAGALGLAFRQADRRGCGLIVVNAWSRDLDQGVEVVAAELGSPHFAIEQRRALWVSEELAGWTHEYPDVDVTVSLVQGHAASALVAASDGAELLVVGSHGRGRLGRAILGSVSRTVLEHAGCPVAVVPPGD